MDVSELLKQLALGELNNLAMSEDGTIMVNRIPRIINYANEGLLRLYTKFVLKEQTLMLEMREDVTFYHLLKRFAYSNYDPANPPAAWDMPYILDMNREPFEQDVIKVLSVYGPDGYKLPLNDLERSDSVFTPQSEILQVPRPQTGKTLALEYQCKHKRIPDEDYESFEIVLPECLHSALRAHIAAKVFSHMNTAENTAKGQEHEMVYLSICQQAIDNDLVNTSSSTTNIKFQKRGWQ